MFISLNMAHQILPVPGLDLNFDSPSRNTTAVLAVELLDALSGSQLASAKCLRHFPGR
jgi:hypothetical protein